MGHSRGNSKCPCQTPANPSNDVAWYGDRSSKRHRTHAAHSIPEPKMWVHIANHLWLQNNLPYKFKLAA